MANTNSKIIAAFTTLSENGSFKVNQLPHLKKLSLNSKQEK
jgi:hypothetical protein